MIFVLLYLFCSWFLPFIKINSAFVNTADGIEVFVKSNGVHTDIIMPVKSGNLNWNEVLPCADFMNVDERYEYVAVGWGDKGFYIDTPTWDDLTFSTVFKAAFGLGGTAMHVTYKYKKPKLSESCKMVVISKEQYLRLIGHIMASFQIKNGKTILIDHDGYSEQDRFYEANGKYSMFATCNVWTGNTLKAAGIKAGAWTPFQGPGQRSCSSPQLSSPSFSSRLSAWPF